MLPANELRALFLLRTLSQVAAAYAVDEKKLSNVTLNTFRWVFVRILTPWTIRSSYSCISLCLRVSLWYDGEKLNVFTVKMFVISWMYALNFSRLLLTSQSDGQQYSPVLPANDLRTLFVLVAFVEDEYKLSNLTLNISGCLFVGILKSSTITISSSCASTFE